MVLYHYGGVYSDMDVKPFVGLDRLLSLLPTADVIVAVETSMDNVGMQGRMLRVRERCARAMAGEPIALGGADDEVAFCGNCSSAIGAVSAAQLMGCLHPIRGGAPELTTRIGNYWMATKPKSAFWRDVLRLVEKRAALPVRSQYDVLFTTGPDVVSEVYHAHRQKEAAEVLGVKGEGKGEGRGEEKGREGRERVHALQSDELLVFNEHMTSKDHAWRKSVGSDVRWESARFLDL